MDSYLRKTLENNLQIIKPVIDEIKSFPSDTTNMTQFIKYIKNFPSIKYSLSNDNLQLKKETNQMLEIPEEPKFRNTINHRYFENERLTINNNTNLTNLNLYFLYNTEKKELNKREINFGNSKSPKKTEPRDNTIYKKKYFPRNPNNKNENIKVYNKTQKSERYNSVKNKNGKIKHKSPKNTVSSFAKIKRDIIFKKKRNHEKNNITDEKNEITFEKNNKNIKNIIIRNIENKNAIIDKKNLNNEKTNKSEEKNHKDIKKTNNKEQNNNKDIGKNNKNVEKNNENYKIIINKGNHKDENNNKINNNNIQNINTILNEEPRGNLILSEFIKLNQIGKGTFGKIFAVKWKKNNKKYALKKETFTDPDFFEKRKGIVKIINDFLEKTKSNGVINIFSSLCQKNKKEYNYYQLMEIGERDWEQEIEIRRKKGLYYSEKEIFNITKQLVQTLSLLQKNNITHRDIKHQNILIANGTYKLCDFGELRIMKGQGLVIQRIRGSELFMSPILFYGLRANLIQVKHNTYKSDVFSLGMCLLYAATMHFSGTDEIREMIDMKQIRITLEKYLKERYSNKFISLLCLMLETDEDLRPDFEQLERKIDNLLIV